MIKHVVMFKLKDTFSRTEIAQHKTKIKALLEELPSLIPQIRLYEIGLNIADSDSAFDVVLISGFDSKDDLNEYRVNEDHQKVVSFIREVVSSSSVVDYEV